MTSEEQNDQYRYLWEMLLALHDTLDQLKLRLDKLEEHAVTRSMFERFQSQIDALERRLHETGISS